MINKVISIVIPAYNEKDNLELLIPEIMGAMSGAESVFEIVVVDDGSNDGSQDILKKCKEFYPSFRYISLTERSGQSFAVFTGIKEAFGDIIITLDADLQNDPKDIPNMMCEFEGVDMVCGIRKNRIDSVIKKASSRIANFVRRQALSSEILDSACGLKIFNKKCLDKIDFFDGAHRFLPDLFLINGFAVRQININHRPRINGSSNYGISNRAIKGIRDLIMVRKLKKKRFNK